METLVKKICAIALLFAAAAPGRIAQAHGVVGDYIFLEPLVAQDPTPANELDILEPSWIKNAAGNDYSIGFELEKALYLDNDDVPRLSIGAGSAWRHQSPAEGPGRAGFDDLEAFGKWAFYVSVEHEFLLSAEVLAQIPSGNTPVEAQSHSSLGPGLLWEKALGDLPNWPVLKYARPLGFQGDVGYLPALGGHTSHFMFADQVVEYSLPYLSNSVKDIGLKGPLRKLFLFTELNYTQLIAGPRGQTFPNMVATPGIAYVGYYFELSLGTQFAINRAAVPGTHAAVIALLDIFYDSIFPRIGNWTVNRGLDQ
jgi:hypothetical protein